MIWNDDKIQRLMSMGMMHGGRGDDPGSAAGGTGSQSSDDTGGGEGFSGPSGDSFGGLGEDLSVDLGGGQSISINSVTGDVTGSGGGGAGGVEGALAEVEQPSAFSQFLSNLSPKQIAAGAGALGGTLFGIGPLAGAALGVRAQSAFGPKDTGLTQTGPGGAPTQQAAGVPSAGGLSGTGIAQTQLGGGGSNQAQQLAAAGRQSGLAPAQPLAQAQPRVNPFGGQSSNFLNRSGVLPQVDLQQFPNTLGRV